MCKRKNMQHEELIGEVTSQFDDYLKKVMAAKLILPKGAEKGKSGKGKGSDSKRENWYSTIGKGKGDDRNQNSEKVLPFPFLFEFEVVATYLLKEGKELGF